MVFRVGQQVVVRADKRFRHVEGPNLGPEEPRVGIVYTIHGFYYGAAFPCLLLVEFGAYRAWDARDFRPVKTTSIELFKSMLSPKPKRVKTRV